ncbi:MAG: 30S ribosomal protein S21 [Spirochaetota bacterium]
MAQVKIEEGEALEKALKRFKRMVEKEGIIREWKKREYFEKPSTVRNKKRKALQRKQMKKARKMQSMRSY